MDPEVDAYLKAVASPPRRRDADTLVALMRQVTGEEPHMWSGVVGFGRYHYQYPSGRQGSGPAACFAARKTACVIYVPDGIGAHADRLTRLGPHTSGVGTIYIKDLTRLDVDVLRDIVAQSCVTLTGGTYRHRARDTR